MTDNKDISLQKIFYDAFSRLLPSKPEIYNSLITTSSENTPLSSNLAIYSFILNDKPSSCITEKGLFNLAIASNIGISTFSSIPFSLLSNSPSFNFNRLILVLCAGAFPIACAIVDAALIGLTMIANAIIYGCTLIDQNR